MNVQRLHSGPRMSQAVIHGDTVYLAGQVAAPGESVAAQTSAILGRIEALLEMSDFQAMNAIWDEWLDGANAPARATGEAKLASPDYKVEIVVTAARRPALHRIHLDP